MWPLVHHPRGRNDQPHSLTGCPDGPSNRNQFTPWTNEAEPRRETFTGVSTALEIGAAAPTPTARLTTGLQIGRLAARLRNHA